MEPVMTEKDLIEKGLGEEYYPISQEILSSFPKYRPAIDLYVFREDIAQLYPFSVKNQRLTNEKVAEAAKICKDGRLFVSRADHHIYVDHLAYQADFVLVDQNLHPSEIKQILIKALSMRFKALTDQALPIVYEGLKADILVFVEYVLRDKANINLFMESLHIGNDDLVRHSLNVLFIGTWLYINTETQYSQRMLQSIAQGLILHDIGCAKLPSFIVNKKTPLTKDELDKYMHHPRLGLALAQKFGCMNNVVSDIIFQHHERTDGSGYPTHAQGKTLTILGMLTAVADSFACMIAIRINGARTKTLKAAATLVKNSQYASRYTEPLFQAYENGSLTDR